MPVTQSTEKKPGLTLNHLLFDSSPLAERHRSQAILRMEQENLRVCRGELQDLHALPHE